MPAELRDRQTAGDWVRPYLEAREREGRLYPDSIVAALPHVPAGHPLAGEWQLRAGSARKLVEYLGLKPAPIRAIELGCGNGWLANAIARIPGSEVVGLDGNPVELEQARRVFGSVPNLRFVLDDVEKAGCPIDSPTTVVLASLIQYVPDLHALIERLLTWLPPGGEIHILDSPIYSAADVDEARARSRLYYERLGVPEMASLYHHHSWSELAGFELDVLYRPDTLGKRLAARLLRVRQTPFPWIRVRNQAQLNRA